MIEYILYNYIICKRYSGMLNGAKPPKMILSLNTLPYYSAHHMRAGLSPVVSLSAAGLETGVVSPLKITVVGKCGETEFIKRSEFPLSGFSPSLYNFKPSGACDIVLPFSLFDFDSAFFDGLCENSEGEISVAVSYGKQICSGSAKITLLARDEWEGLYPGTGLVSFFADADDRCIAELCGGVTPETSADYTKPETFNKALKTLYTTLKSRNIIYTRPVGYSADAPQHIKSPKELFGAVSALATPLELALVFCSAAQRFGLDPVLIFVTNKTGETGVLCGFYTKDGFSHEAVSEDIRKICTEIRYGDLIVTDPGVFAAAQNTSFSLACDTACGMLLGDPGCIKCMVDIKAAKRKLGQGAPSEQSTVSSGLGSLYTRLSQSPAVRYFSGDCSGRFPEIPLLINDFDAFLDDTSKIYRLYALEPGIELSDFAGIDEGFSSVVTSMGSDGGNSENRFVGNELQSAKARLDLLKKRVSRDDGTVCALREEKMCSAASSMVYGENSDKVYAFLGYIRICDKLTGNIKFVPVSYAKCALSVKDGVYCFRRSGVFSVNKIFVRNALKSAGLSADDFFENDMPENKDGIFEMFSEIIGKLLQTDDRYSFGLIKEAHIVCLDMSDYTLMNGLCTYKKKILSGNAAKAVFEKSGGKTHDKNDGKFPVSSLVSDFESMSAACSKENMLVSGAFAHEKAEVLCAYAKKHIADGKNLIVTAKDSFDTHGIYEVLKNSGLADAAFEVTDGLDTQKLCDEICARLEKYKNENENGASFEHKELDAAYKTLYEYEEKNSRKTRLGFTLNELLRAYLDASLPSDGEEIHIDDSVFEKLDSEGFEKLFADAGKLISFARGLCAASGMPEYAPINTHRLYGTRPQSKYSKEDKERIRTLVSNIIPVLSEYRDVFLDVSGICSLELSCIKTPDALCALNDLYKLALSARDVDIPEIFRQSDIEKFSNNAKRVAAIKERCAAIRFRLPFFSPKIFEDVRSLLVADRYEDAEKGFLKKFIHRKNDEDILLQYVSPENTAQFREKPLEEIYSLLYEYKADIKQLDGLSEDNFGFGARLAELASDAGELLDRITCDSRNKALSGFFRLVSVIPADPVLARKITVCRAQLAELFAKGEFSLTELCTLLGAKLDDLRFENGILAFDGLSDFISGAAQSLDVADKWTEYLGLCDGVKDKLCGFVEYIEKHGADGNADRLFARSLLLPACRIASGELFSETELSNVSMAKEKFAPELERAALRCEKNFEVSYAQSLRHLSETYDPKALLKDTGLSLRSFVSKHRSLVSKVLPCIVIPNELTESFVKNDVTFDFSAALDSGFNSLPALSLGKTFALFNMSASQESEMFSAIKNNGEIKVYRTDTICSDKNSGLFAYINSVLLSGRSALISPCSDSACYELIRVNGAADAGLKNISRAQASQALSKACEYVNSGFSRVAVSAFTPEMCEYLKRLADHLRKKSPYLDKVLSDGALIICKPEKMYFADCKAAVVCTVFENTDGVYDCSLAKNSSADVISDVYAHICSLGLEKLCVVSGINCGTPKSMTEASLRLFEESISLCRVPVNVNTWRDASSTVIPGILRASGRTSAFAVCTGKETGGAELVSIGRNSKLCIFADMASHANMSDELVLKYYAPKDVQTMTLMPPELAKNGIKTISDALNGGED